MRSAALWLTLGVLSGPLAMSQSQPAHAPDGGTRAMITSIAVPPLPDAPFTATVNTEWTRILENGATQIFANHRLIARDGQGRVFQERRFLVPPRDDKPTSRLTSTEIADPLTHTIAFCSPDGRMCELRLYVVPPRPALPPAGTSPNGTGSLVREDLGAQTVNGIEMIGTRDITTADGAVVGTDRPLQIIKEFWYSPRLGLNLSTKRMDPRNGVELFTLNDIRQSEPDPNLFALPKNAKIVDYRTLATPPRH